MSKIFGDLCVFNVSEQVKSGANMKDVSGIWELDPQFLGQRGAKPARLNVPSRIFCVFVFLDALASLQLKLSLSE